MKKSQKVSKKDLEKCSVDQNNKQALSVKSDLCQLGIPLQASHLVLGNVILEYLFEFHDQVLNDLELLKAM